MLLNALGWVISGRNDMAVLDVNCPDVFDINVFIVRFLL